jgi:hypothetical protein
MPNIIVMPIAVHCSFYRIDVFFLGAIMEKVKFFAMVLHIKMRYA